jgi:hypothetical protein
MEQAHQPKHNLDKMFQTFGNFFLEGFLAQLSDKKLLRCRGRTILATSKNDVVIAVCPKENNEFVIKYEGN